MSAAAENIATLCERLGLSAAFVFVPLDQSRNKDNKDNPTLNYRVSLQRNGREFVAFDYSMGCGHCPAYKNPPKFPNGKPDPYHKRSAIAFECKTGRTWKGHFANIDHIQAGAAIFPTFTDVIYSAVSDSAVLDYSGFSEWASEYGYDDDSIKARDVYNSCLADALKLQAAIGAHNLAALREACHEY